MPVDHDTDPDLAASTIRWMRAGTVLLVAFVLAFPIYRILEPGRRAEAAQARSEQLAAQGAELYRTFCAQCHGLEGGGGIGPALGSQQFLLDVSDAQIRQLIAVGVPGSQMAAYSVDHGGLLSDEQIAALGVYIRLLERNDLDFPGWRYPLAQEGLTGNDLYNMVCASCHGLDLSGGNEIPALGAGTDAAEESDVRLVRRIREGGDEMPSFAGSLTDQQMELIVDYLRESQGR
ncbi:MAG TPA: c-type cytochrome [Acidimicrobiia bacterium]